MGWSCPSERLGHALCRRCALGLLVLAAGACDDRFESEQPFLRAPPAEQRAQFAKLAPAQQVRVFMAARARELTDDHLCEQLGKASARVMPEVLKALMEEKEDREKRSLLRAIECVRTANQLCDPRLAPIALSVAKSILDKEERTAAVEQADALRCE